MALKSCTKRSVFVYARTQRSPLFMGFGMEVRKRDVGVGYRGWLQDIPRGACFHPKVTRP